MQFAFEATQWQLILMMNWALLGEVSYVVLGAVVEVTKRFGSGAIK